MPLMKRLLVTVLACLLAAPAPALAAATGTLTGRILAAPGAPAAKSVWVAEAKAGTAPAVFPVGPDGTFRAEGVPAGSLALAIDTDAGLYTVETPVTIAPGTTRDLRLALRGRQDTNSPPPAVKPSKRRNVWNNPLAASLIVIGGAVVLGVAVDQLTSKGSSNAPASPSTPAK
jgi:hypothetical protein